MYDMYDALLASARRMLVHRGPPDIQPDELLHEAYLRLAARSPSWDWESPRIVHRAMRDLLVEERRRRAALKRGGRGRRVPLFPGHVTASPVRDASPVGPVLDELARTDPRGYQIVRLRFRDDLSEAQTAVTLGLSERTVRREWRALRRRLRRQLRPEAASRSSRNGARARDRIADPVAVLVNRLERAGVDEATAGDRHTSHRERQAVKQA
jgi:DNA-directed RNA polymerase specialized sigma24 family protein